MISICDFCGSQRTLSTRGQGGHQAWPPCLGGAEEQHLVSGASAAGLEQAGPLISHVCGAADLTSVPPHCLHPLLLRSELCSDGLGYVDCP